MNTTRLPKAMRELRAAIYGETLSTLKVLELIASIDTSREFLRHGYSSLYDYLTVGLKYSEGAANRRIRAARMLKKEKQVKKLFEQRKVSLCTLSLILDRPELLDEITGKSKREVEEIVALKRGNASHVQEKIVPIVVAVPVNKANSQNPTATGEIANTLLPPPASGDTITTQPETVLEERYKVTFSYNKETRDTVEQARQLLSHKYPAGATIEELFTAGLNALIKEQQKSKGKTFHDHTNKKTTATSNESVTSSRYVPAATKREVYKRDNGTCSYRHRDGSKCGSTWQIEFDHITPLAHGGKTETENLRLLCRTHNQMAAHEARLL